MVINRLETTASTTEETPDNGNLAQLVGLGLGLVGRSSSGCYKVAGRQLVLVGGSWGRLDIPVGLGDLLISLGNRCFVILLLLLLLLFFLLLLLLGGELWLAIILAKARDQAASGILTRDVSLVSNMGAR